MRRPFRTSLLRALCAAGLCLGLTACGGSKALPAPLKGANTGGHRSQLFSILESDGAVRDDPSAVFATARSLGIDVIRFDVGWGDYAPDADSRTKPTFNLSNPAAYPASTWTYLDALDRQAIADGVKLYFTMTSPAPLWATGRNPPASQDCSICAHWEPSASDYGAWVRAVGKRYDGTYQPAGQATPLPRISYWSLWNEPNYGPNLAPQATGTTVIVDRSAPQYRKLVDAGWKALAATGHTPATDTILIGETAPEGELNPGTGNMTSPLQFTRDLYCVSSSYVPLTDSIATTEGCPSDGSKTDFAAENPALFEASGWADHPYTDGEPPNRGGGSPLDAANYADFSRLSHLAATLDESAAAWGTDAKLPIYSTEFGYFTDPPLHKYNAVAPSTAAKWLNWSEYLSWKNPRVASYDQYLVADPSSGSTFDTGVEFADGTPKPGVYDAVRMPLFLPNTSAQARKPLTVWGCARPVLTTSPTFHRVAIQFSSGLSHFRTVKDVTLHPTRDGCYFDTPVMFSHSGNVRLAYDNGGTQIVSRLQAITVQ